MIDVALIRLVRDARTAGVIFRRGNGGRLAVQGPPGTDALIAQVGARKADVLDLLDTPDRPWWSCPVCQQELGDDSMVAAIATVKAAFPDAEVIP